MMSTAESEPVARVEQARRRSGATADRSPSRVPRLVGATRPAGPGTNRERAVVGLRNAGVGGATLGWTPRRPPSRARGEVWRDAAGLQVGVGGHGAGGGR